MRSVLVLLLVSAACSRAPVSPSPHPPSEVTELSSLPEGHVAGSGLTESCAASPPGAFEDEALSNVDCSYERLSRALRARAGEQGARFIFGKRCHARAGGRSRLTCSATVARVASSTPLGEGAAQSRAPAPSAAQVTDLDEPRPQDAARIRVSFRAAEGGAGPLPRRAYHRVEETPRPPVGRRALGQVSARCRDRDCSEQSLRHALRVAAGHLGAGELSGVACFREEDGARCIGSAFVPWSS